MSEFPVSNQEISRQQQDMFIEEIERLRPQLHEDEELNAILAAVEDELTDGGKQIHTSVRVSNSFESGGKLITVSIDEESSLDVESGKAMTMGRHKAMISERVTNESGEHLLVHATYEVSRNDFGDGEGAHYAPYFNEEAELRTGPREYQQLPTHLGRIIRDQSQLFNSGVISEGEANRVIGDAAQAKRDFEEQIGEYANRFTVERFADVMTELQQL